MRKVILASLATFAFSNLVYGPCQPSCPQGQFCDLGGACVPYDRSQGAAKHGRRRRHRRHRRGRKGGHYRKQCRANSDCLATQRCNNRFCQDLGENRCEGCKQNQVCSYGKCILDTNPVRQGGCRYHDECNFPEKCYQGECVNPENGEVNRCRGDNDCSSWQRCRGRKCVAVEQPDQQYQFQEEDYPCQATQQCDEYQVCLQGFCRQNTNYPFDNNDYTNQVYNSNKPVINTNVVYPNPVINTNTNTNVVYPNPYPNNNVVYPNPITNTNVVYPNPVPNTNLLVYPNPVPNTNVIYPNPVVNTNTVINPSPVVTPSPCSADQDCPEPLLCENKVCVQLFGDANPQSS